ncbi:hypothetical protein Gbro_4937 (plasmid) [Gordonia bronchialis DSM 43247]|uniref:DUF4913 domain-containing protein n=1 Tax=Gordonia bronchialis (strain ATCC 25592 / DSM 43247 / BCRC 13721 / JCM 3198 / KCTC 3076 / NBRC 16047 / NCTC 10667) TaxID=526226 RepID=D0LFK1_GORB4|nr:DUF4913 domain-containing protein [Gordonia bronchialis]ACY24050.1 hypothetical protein Gbro_4937 [Gordonia bronchialis DSM 43247]MCC3326055.1 DUF4913 domain-containing protein [Gordonia bronchialis]QGS27367.1 DUF4913 domain-containing protein [Gordonia bronchialis]STS10788.1 Uncharacterised protein [Gordonia bronchialis]
MTDTDDAFAWDDTDEPQPEPEPDTPPRRFGSVDEWVDQWLSEVIHNSFNREHRWCAQWWRHEEVVTRLVALWDGWEGARISEDPLAMSGWWVYHFDAHWRALTAENGPLHLCSPEQHVSHGERRNLPHVPMPRGWLTPTDLGDQHADSSMLRPA